MFSVKRFTSAAALAGTLALGAGAAQVNAQPPQNINAQQGLVNVAIFDVIDGDVNIIKDVNVAIAAAANIAANVCGNNVQVGVLALQLASVGFSECKNDTGDAGVIVTQN